MLAKTKMTMPTSKPIFYEFTARKKIWGTFTKFFEKKCFVQKRWRNYPIWRYQTGRICTFHFNGLKAVDYWPNTTSCPTQLKERGGGGGRWFVLYHLPCQGAAQLQAPGNPSSWAVAGGITECTTKNIKRNHEGRGRYLTAPWGEHSHSHSTYTQLHSHRNIPPPSRNFHQLAHAQSHSCDNMVISVFALFSTSLASSLMGGGGDLIGNHQQSRGYMLEKAVEHKNGI